ncbi:MAG: DUF1501 domain-containing protein [Planctomycetota bacterium]|nr:DUF1501 domain-containing protein [Planctomycetota bacterium]MDA1212272.1 DUF1501 domain-containing protein [Planctomycetota bacterium]
MIRFQGANTKLCDGLSRRDWLQVGGLGALGLSLTDWLRLSETQAAGDQPSFGKAKSCILIFLYGSPPQHETFDPKPDAPVEIQGELKEIPTVLPGVAIGELLPKTSQILDKTTIVRSLTHPYPLHGLAYAVTGMDEYTPAIEFSPRDKMHWPFIGSVVDYLAEQQRPGELPAIPRNFGLPWLPGSKCDISPLAGPYSAFLGTAFDPIWTDFTGTGTTIAPKLNDAQTKEVYDPFGGVTPDGKFQLSPDCELRDGVSAERFGMRKKLLAQFDETRRNWDRTANTTTYNNHQSKAYSLLSSGVLRNAIDVNQETPAMREAYGMTLFGQSCLAARRLVEAGGKFISVFWDPFDPFGGSAWDTHANHYPRLKEYLLPNFDTSYSMLIRDLDDRGLLDETLVLCISEHGRTPQIDSKPQGAGRHHWSRAYSAILAGGGISRGSVVGRTDDIAGDVAAVPISPKDILATAFHLMGIDPHTMVPDQLGRPLPIAGAGTLRTELLG